MRLLLLVLAVALQAAPGARPNIVFIFSDDHAYQAISAYGDSRKLIQTPNIDRIAREGVRFDRALVTNSICGPSRAVILTGKYSHKNGFYNNSNSVFDGTQVTFPKLMQKAGYQTAIFGKWHLVSDPVGFDAWQVLPGQGLYYNPPMKGPSGAVETKGYVTDIVTDLSIDWIAKRDKTKPFVLMCQHKAPHREWAPNLPDLGWDKDRVYPEPETLFDDYANRAQQVADNDMTLEKTITPLDVKLTRPANMTPEQIAAWDRYYVPRNEAFKQADPKGKDLVRWRYQRYMHDYLGCVKSVDDNIGRLLAHLEKEGLMENTLIVYSSDQGFYLGEHGWFDKRWIFEESLRTPLVVRWPGVAKPGAVSKAIVSNVDFAQTFLDAAGVEAPADMQGRTLRPVMGGAVPEGWRTDFYYHYYEYPQPHHVSPHYGVITDRYKLVRYYGSGPERTDLFDLEKDPLELKSFAGAAGYESIQADLEARLARLRKELEVPAQEDPLASGVLKRNPPAGKAKAGKKKAPEKK